MVSFQYRVLVRIGLLSMACLFLSACGQMQTKSDNALQKAMMEQASQNAPLSTDLNFEEEYEFALDMAKLEVDRKRYSRAEELLQKMRKVNREDERIYRLLAQVYEAQQKPEMALVAWKQVIQSSNRTVDDESELARLALMNEEFDVAESIYRTWLESDVVVRKISALNNLGFSALLQKRYEAAHAFFEKALVIDPLNTKALNNLKLVNTLIE